MENKILRIIVLIFLFIYLLPLNVLAEGEAIDVVYLKNGSIIKGTITELDLQDCVKIQTSDGSLFVYQIEEVLRIEKEAQRAKQAAPSQIVIIKEGASGRKIGGGLTIVLGSAMLIGGLATYQGEDEVELTENSITVKEKNTGTPGMLMIGGIISVVIGIGLIVSAGQDKTDAVSF